MIVSLCRPLPARGVRQPETITQNQPEMMKKTRGIGDAPRFFLPFMHNAGPWMLARMI
jgi:hypothetical protein